jgi:hypothetical protein
MHNTNGTITIGLFGTCGSSRWRDQFIISYDDQGIGYFNPQVEHWSPALAAVEAQHLASDDIILFPVTDETAGIGSLAEIGFALCQAATSSRYFVFLIEPSVDPNLVADPVLAKESLRSRALVRAHLSRNQLPNVFVCETMQQMLDVSLTLHRGLRLLRSARSI